MRMYFINRKKYLQTQQLCWTLLCLLGCWAALASASEVLVQEVATPAPPGSHRHHLSKTADGRLILSWVEKEGEVRRVRFFLSARMEAGPRPGPW